MEITLVVFILALCLSASAVINKELINLLQSGSYEYIDLTHPFDNSTVYWPGATQFVFIKKNFQQGDDGSWYASNDFAAGEHGGTHIDAPYHFLKEGLMVGDLPLEKLIVPLILVDASKMTSDNPNFVLGKHHLDNMIDYNMGKPCVVVFKFGWSKYFNDKQKYLGLSESDKTLNFPGLSEEVAEWITTSYKNIVGIGVDVASVDPGSSTDFPVHKIAARHGLYNIENINLNRELPSYGCITLMMPMKIAQGTGAPLRMVAICPKSTV